MIIWPSIIKKLRWHQGYRNVIERFLKRNQKRLWRWIKKNDKRIARRKPYFTQTIKRFKHNQLLFAWFTQYLLRTKHERQILQRYLFKRITKLLSFRILIPRLLALLLTKAWSRYVKRGFLETTTFQPWLQTHPGRMRFNRVKRRYKLRHAQPWIPHEKYHRPVILPRFKEPRRSSYKASSILVRLRQFKHELIL